MLLNVSVRLCLVLDSCHLCRLTMTAPAFPRLLHVLSASLILGGFMCDASRYMPTLFYCLCFLCAQCFPQETFTRTGISKFRRERRKTEMEIFKIGLLLFFYIESANSYCNYTGKQHITYVIEMEQKSACTCTLVISLECRPMQIKLVVHDKTCYNCCNFFHLRSNLDCQVSVWKVEM